MYYIYDVSDVGFQFWDIDENIEPGTDWRSKISNSDNSAQFNWSEYFLELFLYLKQFNFFLSFDPRKDLLLKLLKIFI